MVSYFLRALEESFHHQSFLGASSKKLDSFYRHKFYFIFKKRSSFFVMVVMVKLIPNVVDVNVKRSLTFAVDGWRGIIGTTFLLRRHRFDDNVVNLEKIDN